MVNYMAWIFVLSFLFCCLGGITSRVSRPGCTHNLLGTGLELLILLPHSMYNYAWLLLSFFFFPPPPSFFNN